MTGNSGFSKYVIIHGHFYQPPRENAWLDIIEKQESAAPDHDWNERIYDQCYRPNAFSRILDPQGMIVEIVNNYEYLSYNFGPTLFLWLEKNHPKVFERIIEADKLSKQRLNHGNALAQVYNHIIMPLASWRDKITQIKWAKDFFKSRFSREPEGIWLSETAINMETIKCLIDEGIKFTILSPSQAENIRPLDQDIPFKPIKNLDTRHPYRVYAREPNGKRSGGYIDVFFFDEGLSKETSFGNLLINASHFGEKINSSFDFSKSYPQAVIIATDGETFGHHKPFGDMCLSYFFTRVALEFNIQPVNFAFVLEKYPPIYEVTLKNEFGEGSAWSCVHGVGRWTRDCGCKTGGEPSWNQKWREPLRNAFNSIQKELDKSFEQEISKYFNEPWELRNSYIRLCKCKNLEEFKLLLNKNSPKIKLSNADAMLIRRLLESQKYMLFAFTSCGWFFSDVTGIETIQNISYASRALWLGLNKSDFNRVSSVFNILLSEAKSNISGQNGSTIYQKYIVNFFNHLEILCFTAFLEKIILPEKKRLLEFDYFGYKISLSEVKTIQNNKEIKKEYTGFANICNYKTGEEGRFAVCVCKEDGTLKGWLLNVGGDSLPSIDLNNSEAIVNNPESIFLEMSRLFEESKSRFTDFFLKVISKNTYKNYFEWMGKNEKYLDSLFSFGIQLPQFVVAPIKYVLTIQWNKAISEIELYGNEEKIFETLLEISKKAHKFDININYEKTQKIILDLLLAELKIYKETFNTISSDRIRYLLNIIDRFNIPLNKNKAEDIFYDILKEKFIPIYEEYKKSNDSNLKEIIIRFIEFARRMNFNTECFKIF
jgi:alpha-amylase/alpha-mannosidase (GH57 family)